MLTEVLIAGSQLGIKKLLLLLSQYQLSLAFLKYTDRSYVTITIPTVEIRSDLDSFDSSVYESLIVQISQPTISVKDIIIGVIYKPPNTNVETFLSHFIVVLEKLSKENRPSYLLGDYNIDLLKYNHQCESFLNQILTYGFFPKIDSPTRIMNTSATLIDNIITNVHDKNLISRIWAASVSDHLPIFLSLPHEILKRTPHDRTEIKRIYSNQNYENFQNKIRDIDIVGQQSITFQI